MADTTEADPSEINTAEKGPLNLCDLPIHILEKVTSKLPLNDCLALRKVSRDLRSFVDSTTTHCELMYLTFLDHKLIVRVNDLELVYVDNEDGDCEVTVYKNDVQERKLCLDHRNFKEVVLTDVASFLEMPKLEIGRFKFMSDGTATWSDFMQLLKSLKFRLNVKSIQSDDLGLLHSVHEFTKPEKLEEILADSFDNVSEFIEAAENNLEILKNPKMKIDHIEFGDDSDELVERFAEILDATDCQLHFESIDVVNGRWIPVIFEFMNPEQLEYLMISDETGLTLNEFYTIAGSMNWTEKVWLYWCKLPEEIDLEELVDFKWIETSDYELDDENLIKIRDVLLKSPHLESLKFRCSGVEENLDDEIDGQQPNNEEPINKMIRDMYEKIDRIMSQDKSYDATTRRFSIPNSLQYFQFNLETWEKLELTIEKTSPK